MPELQLHPLCTLFPRMEGAEFQALRADIMANGLRQPIILHKGMILDGGNRYRACNDAGIEPQFIEFVGDNIVSFVLSANLHRRHMSAGQQAAIVASAQDWATAQTVGKPQLRNVAQLDTAKTRAAASGASHRTQQMADTVAKKNPALAKQVAHGEISLPKALQQVSPRIVTSDAEKPERTPAKPAKGAPTIESLQAALDAEREAHEETRQNARELSDLLESYTSIEGADHDTAKELARLRGLMRTIETQRDTCMTTCNELRREVKARDRVIATLEKKAGAK